MVDKEEVALSLNIRLTPQESKAAAVEQPADSVSAQPVIVSEPAESQIAQRVLQILALQGVSCGSCPRCSYKLYPLSDDGEGMLEGGPATQRRFRMEVLCHSGRPVYVFELSTRAVDAQEEGGRTHG